MISIFLCVTDIFGKYAWVISLKNRKVITKDFQSILNASKRKQKNPTYVDKSIGFYNRSMK